MNRLEKISELYAKATPGRWVTDFSSWPGTSENIAVQQEDESVWPAEFCHSKAEAELIVALHNAWPAIEKALNAADKVVVLTDSCSDYINSQDLDPELFRETRDAIDEYESARKELEG